MTVLAAYKGPAGPDVLAFATRWAGGGPVEVVTVYPAQAPIGPGRLDAEWVAENRQEAERILGEAREHVGAGAARFRSLPAESAPRGLHDAMVDAGSGTPAVLGSRNTRGVRRTAPGSTADRLLTGAPGPVAIVPWDYEEAPPTRIARIAVAWIDTADGRAALEAARTAAARLDARVEIVTAVPDTRVRPAQGEPGRFAEEQRADYRDALRSAAAPGESTRLLDGPVVDALTDLRPEDTDLLVCGSRGYGPARRVLLGGVSARVLRQARVPVLVVPRP